MRSHHIGPSMARVSGFLLMYVLWRDLEPGSTGRVQGFELPSIRYSAPAAIDATAHSRFRVPDTKRLWKNVKSQMTELLRENLEKLALSIMALETVTASLAKFRMAGQGIRWNDHTHECLSSEPFTFLMQDPGRIARLFG